MRKTRVVIYLDSEQRNELESRSRGTSLSEVRRRAIQEFLKRRNGNENKATIRTIVRDESRTGGKELRQSRFSPVLIRPFSLSEQLPLDTALRFRA